MRDILTAHAQQEAGAIADDRNCRLAGCTRPHSRMRARMRALRAELDRQADERLEYGRPLSQPVAASTARVFKPAPPRPPRLSRWTPYGQDRENPRFTAPQ